MLLDGSQPVRYGLKVDMDEKYQALKRSLSKLCGIRSSALLLAEVFGAVVKVWREKGGSDQVDKGGGLWGV